MKTCRACQTPLELLGYHRDRELLRCPTCGHRVCPVCGAALRLAGSQGAREVYRCTRCRFTMTWRPQPTLSEKEFTKRRYANRFSHF